MSCNKPLVAYRIRDKIVFNREDHTSPYYVAKPFNIPCGKCWKCRLTYARTWAIRCMHEASMHDNNCFLTLTFNQEHLPKDGSLNVRHFQLFMKKLRNKTRIKKLRYFHSGEYGDKLGRPHYHALIFGYDFPDKEYFKSSNPSSWNKKDDKYKLYTSETLNELWPYGYAIIGDVSFQSASYVARYVMKKINGENAKNHYGSKQPEYCTMSRRPAIGKEWYLDHGDESCHNNDRICIHSNDKYYYFKPPRYYDELLKIKNKELFDKIKAERIKNHDTHLENYLDPKSRLYQLDKFFENKIKKQIRRFELDS